MRDDDIALEIYYDGAWHDLVIDDKVLADQEIVITRGDGAESAAIRPCTITAGLDNATDMFRTSNPESPLYGKAGRNTPLRVSVGGVVRGAGELSSLKCGQTRDFRATPRRGRAWADLEAGGLLQRIAQWTETVKSPMRAFDETLSTRVGHWPAEERENATALTSLITGSSQRSLRSYAFGSSSFPAGSGPVLDIRVYPNAIVSGNFASTGTTNDGWQYGWSALYGDMPAATVTSFLGSVRTTDGTLYGLYHYDTDEMRFIITPINASSVVDVTFTLPSNTTEVWTHYVLKVTESAGTVTAKVFRMSEEETSFTELTSQTFAGTTSALARFTHDTGHGTTDVSYGHFIGLTGSTESLTSSDRCSALLGHPGERTAYRLARLCGLKGIQYYIRGDFNLSEPMGPQSPNTFAGHLMEIRDTEDGLIFDEQGSLALIFTVRDGRYVQTATTIDVSELVAAPEEVTDDLGVHNIVTVENLGAGEATARDDTGPLGTAEPPDGVGEYEHRVKVNVNDPDTLPDLANWWLRRSTVDLPRYPKLTVNLSVLDPARAAAIADIDIGEVIELTGFRENTLRLYVLGIVEKIPWKRARTITFTCFPDQQFNVGIYDSAISRYDLRTCTTSGSHGPTATTITLAMTADEAWSTTSAYDLFIAGELIGVPAGGMGARTGTFGAYQQVITGAVRSKNGVRKTLPAGSSAHVSTPGRWAR